MRFIFILLLFPFFVYSQKDKITIKKQDTLFYFFQVDKKSDTILRGKNDLFYLHIPASKRCNTKIEVKNAQLLTTKTENIYKLKPIPGINYIHLFSDSLTQELPLEKNKKPVTKKTKEPCVDYKTLVNGANNGAAPSNIVIRFIDTKTNSLFLSNKFYCK